MPEWLVAAANKFIKLLGVVLTALLYILPESPFQKFLQSDSNIKYYLDVVNYFIPIYTFVAILEAWVAAIAIYYVVQCVLRWVKYIE